MLKVMIAAGLAVALAFGSLGYNLWRAKQQLGYAMHAGSTAASALGTAAASSIGAVLVVPAAKASTEVSVEHPQARVAMPQVRVAMPQVRVAMPQVRVAMPQVRVAMPQVRVAMQRGASDSARTVGGERDLAEGDFSAVTESELRYEDPSAGVPGDFGGLAEDPAIDAAALDAAHAALDVLLDDPDPTVRSEAAEILKALEAEPGY